MKPSSGDKQLGMLSPLKSAAMQSGQTNHPSQNEAGLDVSHHIHLSLEGREKYFFLDILFHRMSVMAIWTKPRFAGSWKVVRFGRAICMLHAIRASSAIRTVLYRSMSESTRNCRTALNPHKAIALPNPQAA